MAEAPGISFRESAERIMVRPAGAALAGFMGLATRGRIDRVGWVRGWPEFVELYGAFQSDYGLADALWEFFRNGGAEAKVLRIVADDAVGASNEAGMVEKLGTNAALKLYASSPGAWGDSLSVSTSKKSYQVVGDAGALVGAIPGIGFIVNSLAGISIGDVFDIYDPATGQLAETGGGLKFGPMVIVGMVSNTKEVYATTPLNNYVANQPTNAILKSGSSHRATTYATEQLDIGATSIALQSVEGIKRGSLLSLSLCSIASTDPTKNAFAHEEVVVQRIVGNRVYFTVASGNAAVVSAATAAFLRIDVDVANSLDLTAVTLGPGGNNIAVQVVAAAANSIVVRGHQITINNLNYTLTTVVAALAANAQAAALVSAVVRGLGATAIVTAALTSMRGGARLQATSQEFDLVLRESGVVVEENAHRYLSIIPDSQDYVETRLGGTIDPLSPGRSNPSLRLIVEEAAAVGGPTNIQHLPVALDDLSLTGGVDGSDPLDEDFIGNRNPTTGMYLFDAHDDVDMLLAPGRTSATLQSGLLTYASARGDLVVLLDMPEAITDADDMQVYRAQDLAGVNNSYGALYAPWGKILDPRPDALQGTIIDVPPTPAVAGMRAQVVLTQGIHYVEANRTPFGWLGLTENVPDAVAGDLNSAGINLFRIMNRLGLRLYGARTLSGTDDGRQFTNARYWLNYMKQSLRASLSAYIFEPASTTLFSMIEASVIAFLTEEWRKGALFPQDDISQAFAVKCDTETTTSDDLAHGNVFCDIAVSPVTPAERIIFRINVSAGGVRVTEA